MEHTAALIPLAALLTCGCVRMGYHEQPGADLQPVPDADVYSGSWAAFGRGTFMMGSPEGSPCRYDNEELHQVTLTRGFEIQTTEVTQAQFAAVMGYNPAYFDDCSDCPVEMVHWHQAAAYCNALSTRQGMPACYLCQGDGDAVRCSDAAGGSILACGGYRLPTEAEWEYAYRAGTTTPFYNGPNDPALCKDCDAKDANADKIGWYCANAGSRTHPVGQKLGNAWGLFDMAGNVWEWCHDGYTRYLGSAAVTDPVGAPSAIRSARGGCWINNASALHASQRFSFDDTHQNNGIGFRCLRTIP